MNKQELIEKAIRLIDDWAHSEPGPDAGKAYAPMLKFLNTYLSAPIERVPDEYYCLEAMSADELRAYDYAFNCFTKAVERILDGKDTGEGIANHPWQGLRERLIKLVKKDSNE